MGPATSNTKSRTVRSKDLHGKDPALDARLAGASVGRNPDAARLLKRSQDRDQSRHGGPRSARIHSLSVNAPIFGHFGYLNLPNIGNSLARHLVPSASVIGIP